MPIVVAWCFLKRDYSSISTRKLNCLGSLNPIDFGRLDI